MVPGLYFFVNGTTSTCLHNQCPRMIDYKGIGTVVSKYVVVALVRCIAARKHCTTYTQIFS